MNHFSFWGDDVFDDLACNERKGQGFKRQQIQLRTMEMGRSICFGKGGGDAPTPDPGIGRAAEANVELGKNWLSFAREQFAEGNNRQEATDALSSRVVNQQMASQDNANRRSDQQWADYKGQYRPIERMNLIDSMGGSNLSDDQVRDIIGKQNASDFASLQAEHDAKLAAINSMSRGGATVKTAGMSPEQAEKMVDGFLGKEPVKPTNWSEANSLYTRDGNKNFNEDGNQVDPYLGQRNYEAAVKDYAAKREKMLSSLTGLGGTSTTTPGMTDAELQALRDGEIKRFESAKAGVTDVTDQVMGMRGAERNAQAGAAAAAKADVLGSASTQQQANARQMASMGIDPSSGRFAGITRAQDTNTALAAAGAQNNARTMVKNQGIALRADQANYGRGGSAVAAQQAGLGLNSGNAAVGNNQSANQNFFQNQGVMTQGFNGNIGANNSAGGMLNNLYSGQLDGWRAQTASDASSAAGTGQLVGVIGMGAMAF